MRSYWLRGKVRRENIWFEVLMYRPGAVRSMCHDREPKTFLSGWPYSVNKCCTVSFSLLAGSTRGLMRHDDESHSCTPNYKNCQHSNLSFRSRRHRPISPGTHKRAIWNRTFRDGHERCQRDYHITRETNTSRPSRTREQSLFKMAVFSSVTRCWWLSWMHCVV